MMSASSRPTRAPALANATARLLATVDLPTPPLLLATAMMLRTPSMVFWPSRGAEARTFAPHSRAISVTPSIGSKTARISRSMVSLSGQAGVVSSTLRLIRPPSMTSSFTMPSRTMLACNSGSLTDSRAAATASRLIVLVVVIDLAGPFILGWRRGSAGLRGRFRNVQGMWHNKLEPAALEQPKPENSLLVARPVSRGAPLTQDRSR